MRILWVKVGGLWPLNTGGRLRSFHILSELSRRHRVTLLTTHAPGEDPHALHEQLPGCERIVSFPHSAPKWNSPRFPWMLLRSWFSRLPVDLWKCRVPVLQQEVSRLIKAHAVDLCIADFLVAVPNVDLGGGVPIVYFSHNVEYLIWQRLYNNERRAWRRVLLGVEWRKLRRFEAETCRRVHATIAVSPQDRDLLITLAPGSDVRAVPTGVDISYFAPQAVAEIPDQLAYVGSMDWRPNEDAVLYFIDSILPLIRQQRPAATLTVIGRNPSTRLRQAAARADVTVTGTVPDVRNCLAVAAVVVVPLRIGGGTRLKIFEALAMGKAVVSTTVGAEGLPLTDGEHFVCADEPAAFADAVVTLLQDTVRRNQLGIAGRQLVENHYSWSQVTREFEALIESGKQVSATEPKPVKVIDVPGQLVVDSVKE